MAIKSPEETGQVMGMAGGVIYSPKKNVFKGRAAAGLPEVFHSGREQHL
jgi:hypothetical protein